VQLYDVVSQSVFNQDFADAVPVDKPQFLPGQVPHAYAWAGQHRVLKCRFHAEPAATVEWFIRGVKLESNATFHIVTFGSNSSLEVGELILCLKQVFCELSNELLLYFGEIEDFLLRCVCVS